MQSTAEVCIKEAEN